MATIGKSISFKGDLSGDEDLVLEGSVEGKVELPNNQLTVGANGRLKAEVTAKAVVVVGQVIGNVHGLERVEVQASGKVQGDITAPKLIVAEGAELNGAVRMTEPGKTASAAPPKPASPEVRKAG